MKTTLGALKLSPIKEESRFVFLCSEIRMNNKLNKGDYIKIFVLSFQTNGGKNFIDAQESPLSKMVIRGMPFEQKHEPGSFLTIEDLYLFLCDQYRSQFYFGKMEP